MAGPQWLPPEMAGRNFKRPSLACQARNLTHLVRPFEVLRLHRRKVIAAIEDPAVIIKILSHLGLPTRAPPRTPAHRVNLFQTI